MITKPGSIILPFECAVRKHGTTIGINFNRGNLEAIKEQFPLIAAGDRVTVHLIVDKNQIRNQTEG